MPATQQRLILIDGSSFLFRAFHAIKADLTNPKGQPTNAIYGVTNMLKKLLVDHQTEYFTVVFDALGKTFRHDLYEQYKANRPPMPDDLRVQIQPLHDLIKAMGLPLIMESDVEADDVIGALAKYAEQQGFQVVISTGDKDMAQLVNEHITLENTMSNTTMDREGVIKKFGVTPEQIIDYLALMGDTVDNIPGVPKVGPKTAAKWLNEYGNLDNVIASAEKIKGKVGENLRASLERLPLSRALTTIKCDLGLDYTMADLKQKSVNNEELAYHLSQQGFSSWLRQVQSLFDNSDDIPMAENSNSSTAVTKNYETVLSKSQFEHLLQQLQNAELFAFDTETTSLDYAQAEIVGVSFAMQADHAAYVPLAHDYPGAPKQLERRWVLDKLQPLLEDPKQLIVGQNLKYDAHVLSNHGIELRGIEHDTMLQSYVLNSIASRHNMDALAQYYLGLETIHYEEVAGKGVKQITFNEVTIEQATPYAAEDADITLQLHQTLWPQLQQHSVLQKLYQNLEIPVLSVLTQMEKQGVLLDSDMLAQQSQTLAKQIVEIEQQAFTAAGQSFNLGSPKQIQTILYEQLNLPILKKTPKGQPSTAEAVLQKLAEDYKLPKLILEYRSMSKLKSTYTDKLPLQVNAKTGRVHTSYQQAVAATGRLSSSNPNLQNIPIRSEQGRKIRQAFIAPPGYKLLAADYSQIELRIMTHLSADESLLSAFSQGLDIHRATAAEVFEVAPDQVTPDLRRSAKAINFGLIYGMSAFGLARQLGLARNEAQSYIDLYFSRYPSVKNYMDTIRVTAAEQGYVETLWGRRLYLPEIKSRNATRRQYAERTAINAPMQGTAADIIKQAMIAADNWLQTEAINARMIMQVHDELVFEIDENEIEYCRQKIDDLMSSVVSLLVPLIVEIGVGDNWDQAH